MKIFYMGLEPYEGRYTLQLQDWTEQAYKKRNIRKINLVVEKKKIHGVKLKTI